MKAEFARFEDAAGTIWSVKKDFSAGHGAPTLVCLHGFTGSSEDFEPLLSAISDIRPVNSICVDLPGHGKSRDINHSASFLLENITESIGRMCEDCPDQNNVFILGYSMGARIGLHYLLTNPSANGILIGGSPGLSTEEERIQRINSDAVWIRKLQDESYSIEQFCDEWEAQAIIHPQTLLPDPLCSSLLKRRRNNSKLGLANALQHWGAGVLPGLWGELSGLNKQLLITGENDNKFREIAIAMNRINPALEIRLVKGAAHAPHLDNPAECAEIIIDCLQKYQSSA